MPERDHYERGVPCWADLATTDPDAAQRFYGELFGWDWEGEATDMGPIYYQARIGGRRVIGMSEQPPEMARAGAPAMWNAYLATDDCDATTKAAEAAGGTVLMAPMDVMQFGRMAFVADPTGAAFGIWQARSHIGSELVNEPGAVIWNEVLTNDTARAAEFYEAAFGLSTQVMPVGDGQYQVLQVGGRGVGGLINLAHLAPEAGPPHWQVTFAVEDCDASVGKVTAIGGSVMAAPFDIPTVGRFALVADPQGAGFGVLASEGPTA